MTLRVARGGSGADEAYRARSHLALIAAPLYLVMALTGLALFGRVLPDFARLDRALFTCFRLTFGWFWEPEKVSLVLSPGGHRPPRALDTFK